MFIYIYIHTQVIFSCLKELSQQGPNGQGIVESVVFMGGVVSVTSEDWSNVRAIVAGKFVNCYCSVDTMIARGAGLMSM